MLDVRKKPYGRSYLMSTIPETRYVRSGNIHLACQTVGTGPDLVFIPNWVTHIEAMWEEPLFARYLDGLSSFSRLILYDQRGTGLSDPVPLSELPTLEQWMEDVVFVLDQVGSQRAALLGYDGGGPMAALMAAAHPERISGLILLNSFARFLRADDYPWGLLPASKERVLNAVRDGWGTGSVLETTGPSVANDPDFRHRWGRYYRQVCSPGTAVAMMSMLLDNDVRHVLPSIRVPTLVLHRKGDRWVAVEHGRYLAEAIPGAKLVELPGDDHIPFLGDMDRLLAEIRVFVAEAGDAPEPERFLTTIVFTDIVDSTGEAARLGDREWRRLLDAHDALVMGQVERFRGEKANHTGDGLLAIFDGPARAVRFAHAVRDLLSRRLGVQVRVGIHTGEVERREPGIGGIAVHAAARILSLAESGEVLASRTVRDLVAGAGITFVDRGSHALRGVPGEWQLFATHM